MKMLIDVDDVEFQKIVYCIKSYNSINGLSADQGMDHSSIVSYAIGKLANEYLCKYLDISNSSKVETSN